MLQCVSAVSDRFNSLSGTQSYQFLMLGLEGAGKTTFLYKLKINGYKKADVQADMVYLKEVKQDPGYHFEELSSPTIGQYSIWEVPGNDVMRPLWPMFYRYLHIHGVFFVVDAFSPTCFDLDQENFRKLSKARDALFHLLHEDELRVSVFFLVLNVNRSTEDAAKKEEEEQEENALFEMLGVPEIEKMVHMKTRFRKVVLNCANISRKDSNWENILKDFRKMQVQIQSQIGS
eukprot:s1902_g12.t1